MGLRRQGLFVRLSSPVYAHILRPDPVQVRAEMLGGIEIEGQLERGSTRKALGWCPARLIVKNAGLVVFCRNINPVNPASKLDLFSRIKAKGNRNIGGQELGGRGSLRFSNFRPCLLCLKGVNVSSNSIRMLDTFTPYAKKRLKRRWTKTVRRLALALEKGV